MELQRHADASVDAAREYVEASERVQPLLNGSPTPEFYEVVME